MLHAGGPLSARPLAVVYGHAVSSRALLGVRYRTGLEACRRDFSLYPPKAHTPVVAPSFYPLLGIPALRVPSAARLYRQLVQAALWRYLTCRVYARFAAHYKPKIGRFVDFRNLAPAAAIQAEVSHAFFVILYQALRRGWSCRQLDRALQRKFGTGSHTRITRQRWSTMMAFRARKLATLQFCCYPAGPQSWQLLSPYNSVGNIAVWSVMMRRLSYWTRRTNFRLGNLGVALMVNPPDCSGARALAAAWAKAFTHRSGKWSPTRLMKGGAILTLLGSPTTLGYGKWSLAEIAARCGLGRRPVPLRRSLHWRHDLPARGDSGILFVFQTTPPMVARPKGFELAPAGLIFNTAKEALLTPIAEHLLAHTVVFHHLKLPSVAWLVWEVGSGTSWRYLFGKKIPVVIKKYPSNSSGWQ